MSGQSILFTTSATRNNASVAIGRFTVQKHPFPLVTNVTKIKSRTSMALFTGKLKSVIIFAQSPFGRRNTAVPPSTESHSLGITIAQHINYWSMVILMRRSKASSLTTRILTETRNLYRSLFKDLKVKTIF